MACGLQCGITGLPVNVDDPCLVLQLVEKPHESGKAIIEITDLFAPASFPQPARYAGDGEFNVFKLNEANALFRGGFDGMPFAVFHVRAFDALSTKPYFSLGSGILKTFAENPAGHFDKSFSDFIQYRDDIGGGLPSGLFGEIQRQLPDPSLLSDPDVASMLKREFVELGVFLMNMRKLNKLLMPAKAAPLDDNYEIAKAVAELTVSMVAHRTNDRRRK